MESGHVGEYQSCEWIEGGIAFNRSSLHTCLIAHHNRGLPFIQGYRGAGLRMEAVLQVREEIRHANRNGGYAQCTGCAHLKTRSWPKGAHPIRIVGIAHYSHCNIECDYCFLQTQDRASFADGFRPYSLLDTFRSLIADGSLAPNAIIDWGGGEPTAYREFDPLFEMLLTHGTTHYLHTNGTILPDSIRNARAPERIHVICSVDAGLPQTYLAMKKRDYLERVWLNLGEYRRLGVSVTGKYIVKSENCSDLEVSTFLVRAADAGLRDLIVDIDYNFPNPDVDVVTGAARLIHGARRAGMHARFGFTGDNFAPEGIAGERVAAALAREELAGIAALLNGRGYALGHTVDGRAEQLLASLDTHNSALEQEVRSKDSALNNMLAQCLGKETEILDKEVALQNMASQCIEKEHEIRRLHAALVDLRRPRTLVRALALDALGKLGLRRRRA